MHVVFFTLDNEYHVYDRTNSPVAGPYKTLVAAYEAVPTSACNDMEVR